MVEVNKHPWPPLFSSSGPTTPGCQPLKMLSQDGSLLEFSRKVVKGSSNKLLESRVDKVDSLRDLDWEVWQRGRI